MFSKLNFIYFAYSLCVTMVDWFNYHGHICIAFELLGLSTYDFQVSFAEVYMTLCLKDYITI